MSGPPAEAQTIQSQTIQAQTIQKCRIDGRLVFQTSACPAAPPIITSEPQATKTGMEATPAAPRKRTLAELLRERDGASPAPRAATSPQADGANVLKARMGAI